MGIAKRKKSVAKGVKALFPGRIDPMLCKLVDKVVNDEDYLYEVKFDGYRITAHKNKGKVILRTRSALDYSKRYAPVVDALKNLSADVVLDGEVVVLNEEGKHDFTLLQNYQRTHEGRVVYYVFDILWLNGYSLMHLPLNERKAILSEAIESSDYGSERMYCFLTDWFRPIFAFNENYRLVFARNVLCKDVNFLFSSDS